MPKITKTKKINYLIFIAFIWAITIALIAYAQTTFLNSFFSLETVSLIIFISNLAAFILMNQYPNIIAKYSNFKTTLAVFFIEILSLLIFILTNNNILIFFAFITYAVIINITYINFDIFLEAQSSDKQTGRIRGLYYTIYNIGWVISPFISGLIIANFGFNQLFLAVIILILPILLLLNKYFSHDLNHYAKKHFKILDAVKRLLKRKNLEKIFYIAFLLQFFYAVMVLYIPIYLNQTLGIGWEALGIIFSVMLIPFILIEYPAGWLADKLWGEKEMLTAGIVITILASLAIFFINSSYWPAWALILFFSRIGASLIEIMRDSYFFKKVSAKDLELINAFRSTMPLAYITVPLISAVIIHYLPIQFVFIGLAIVMTTGLYFSLTLKDTK